MVIFVKRDEEGIIASGRRRLLAFSLNSFLIIFRQISSEGKEDLVVSRYSEETGKRFRFLYRILSPDRFIDLSSKMVEALGWYKLISLEKVKDTYKIVLKSLVHEGEKSEERDALFNFFLKMSEGLIEGIYKNIKLKVRKKEILGETAFVEMEVHKS